MISKRAFLAAAGATVMTLSTKLRSAPALDSKSSLSQLTLHEAAAAVRSRKISPVALTEACLKRIEKYNGSINAFITVVPENALAQARRAEAEVASGHWRGPLHGIPIALKDNIDTAAIRTTSGSAVFAKRIPSQDAHVVRRLQETGAVVIGKANLNEFGVGSGHWGTVRNPWQPEHWAGGSSGGPAAAVALDLCYGAIGTDLGGSIRCPASYCGVVGLMPSYGLVSTRGVYPALAGHSLDCIGPICKTVEDSALLLQAIAGYDLPWPESANVAVPDYFKALTNSERRFRVGIPRADFFTSVDREVSQTVEAAIEVLRSLGADVKDITFPYSRRDLAEQYFSVLAEVYAYHKPILEQHSALYHPSTRETITLFSEVDAVNYIVARDTVQRIRKEIQRFFEGIDFLVMPTMRTAAPIIQDAPGTQKLTRSDLGGFIQGIYNTWIANVIGSPAISVPCGFTKKNLPVGLQIVGAPFAESELLAFAHAYERAAGWSEYRPWRSAAGLR